MHGNGDPQVRVFRYLSRDIRANQLEHTLLRVPIHLFGNFLQELVMSM